MRDSAFCFITCGLLLINLAFLTSLFSDKPFDYRLIIDCLHNWQSLWPVAVIQERLCAMKTSAN